MLTAIAFGMAHGCTPRSHANARLPGNEDPGEAKCEQGDTPVYKIILIAVVCVIYFVMKKEKNEIIND